MRLKALLLTAIAGIIMFAGCAQEDHQDIPYLDLSGLPSDAVLNFSADASSQTFTIVTNRPWHVDIDDIWINVEPASGPASTQPQEIRVTVLSNEYFNRTASVKVSLDYDYRTITINQVGGWGDPEDMVIYKNNFDKEAATQSYGTSGTSWPYTDQSDCWKNEEGTGIENIAYTVSGISVRNNSNSNGNYSDYEGSGTNNLFFGTRGGFKVANLNVEGKGQDFQLTFGSEKYLANGSSVFDPSEFHIWVGNDEDHMVEVEYSFPSGFKDGRWDLATSVFTIPEGTSTLCIYFKTDVASAYRLDDVNLSVSTSAGTPLNFDEGVNPDGGGGGQSGTILYYNNFDKAQATQTYGTGTSWPYTDQSDCWKNQTGEGAANVEYYATGVTVRANSASDGSYSDYPGSGMNNLFFGRDGMFKIKGITTLPDKLNYKITFGSEKYLNQGDSNFNPQEFHVYVGKDTLKWVEISYQFANGLKSGRWDLADATITIPAQTGELYFRIQTDVASAYRLDDFKVEVSEESGQAIDFEQGIDLDGGGDQPGDETVVYFNDFDKTKATQTYGTGNSWPFTDQSDCWKNHTGEGTVNVGYYATGITVRANSASDGSYSDYSGSGVNNLFFGTNGMFKIKNITPASGKLNYKITFGSEKYLNQGDSNFNPQEFHVYVGQDTVRWVEISYRFPNGLMSGRWDLAEATITIPAGTNGLYFRIQADVASAYRLDDFKVVVSEEQGTVIDFSQGVILDDDSGDDQPDDPGTTYTYRKVSRVSSGKAYLIVTTDGKIAAGPVPANKNFGYLPKVDVSASNDVITTTTDANEFVFEEIQTPGSVSNEIFYTIRQKDGRYLYMSGTYTSANVSATPTEGQEWTVTSGQTESDGLYIRNASKGKWMQYSTTHSSWGVYDSPQDGALMPHLYERVDDGGETPGGDDVTPGGDDTGSEISWTVGSDYQTWTAETDQTYGAGFYAQDNSIKVAYYKNTSSSNPVTANNDHIRIYKYSVLVITPTGGKKVKKVVLETTATSNTSDMTILSPTPGQDGSGATATASGTTITWTGTAGTPWIAKADNGQVRVKKLTVTLE